MLICNAVLTDADGARPGDVRIENGVITAVGEGLAAGGDEPVLDAGGRTLAMPAFIDLHCHFRTPGFEHKEDSRHRQPGGCRGAATRSSTAWPTQGPCVLPAAIAQSVMDEARRVGLCDVNQCVSITKDFDGKTAEPSARAAAGTSASSARTAKACARVEGDVRGHAHRRRKGPDGHEPRRGYGPFRR